ncbi:hypothetical protein [Methanogenium cariaci]|uniref:hypothetical protein n=1 Tax=Methanogenium cariaci TaxID=2197 RepID=UPI001FDEEB44|nr:hypothetical protein [Methanogenium cariaci]
MGGGITCTNAVIGNQVRIKGFLNVIENVTVCDDTCIESLHAGGDIMLRPRCAGGGDVSSDETIFVCGKIKSGKLTGRNVKVVGNGP